MRAPVPIIRQDGEGERFWFAGGGVFTMKASALETAEAFTLVEDEVTKGKTTPLHLHPDFDEAIYVLEGEIIAHVNDEEHSVGEHGLFVAPRGVPHAFLVVSDRARLLVIQTPGTGEAFYRDSSEPLLSEDDASRPADFARLRAVAERSPSIELLGPPPFASLQAGQAVVG